MNRVTGTRARILLIGSLLLAALAGPASATVIGFPGTAPVPPTFGLPAGPPDPNLAGYNLYPFSLGQFIPPLPATPNPLPNVLFAESPLQFNLVMIAGFAQTGHVDPIVVAQTIQFFITGDFWSVKAQLTYDPAVAIIFSPNDVVTLSGAAQHTIAPHPGEVAPGPSIPFNVELNGGRVLTLPADFDVPGPALQRALRDANLPAGARFGIDVRSAVHDPGPHEDVIVGLMAGQIASPNNPIALNEFEFWVGGLVGAHTPEPATLLLWAATAAGAGFVAYRRRKHGAS